MRIAAGIACALLAGAASAQLGGKAYVSNQDGAVTVIDLATLEATATLDVAARGPRGIGVTDDGAWLVTANLNDGNVSVIDTATGRLVRQLAIGKSPEYVRVVGKVAYVTYEPGGSTGNSGAPGANDKDDERIPGHIAVVDLASGRILHDIVGKPETEGLEFSADGKRLIVTNESDNSLGEYDVASGQALRTVSVAQYGNRPRGIKRSPDGKTYLVTLERADKLLVLDADLKVQHEVAVGKAPYGVAFDRSGARAFVAANREKALQVFDTRTWAKIKDVPSGERCWHFSFTPDEQRVLLACGKSNEVVVVDAQTLTVVKRIGGLKTPWGIVAYPRSPGSID